MNFAYIQARQGSKRFPGKNKVEFLGKSMIVYAIDKCKAPGIFDEIIVASDDPDILEIAKKNVVIPWRRKPVSDLQTDDELAQEIIPQFKGYEIGCRVYPAIPLLSPHRFVEALQLIYYKYNAVRTVAEYEHPLIRAFCLNNRNLLKPVNRFAIRGRTQNFERAFYDPGVFMMFRVNKFQGTLLMDNTAPIILPWWEYQDIDYPGDLKKLEAKYRFINGLV